MSTLLFELTASMMRHFRNSLRQYHNTFDHGRCKADELEELLVKAIMSDAVESKGGQKGTKQSIGVTWTPGSHQLIDIVVVDEAGSAHEIQVKSGVLKPTKQMVEISGNRLGRYVDFTKAQQFDQPARARITTFLQQNTLEMISVWHRKADTIWGDDHEYIVTYLDAAPLCDVNPDSWRRKGSQWLQTNSHGIEFSLRPTMSWQIWWLIPETLFTKSPQDWFSTAP